MDIQPQLMLGTLFTLEGEVARADGLAASCNPIVKAQNSTRTGLGDG